MATPKIQLQGKLEIITALSDLEPSVDVVLIPGIRTVSAAEWGFCQPPWLAVLRQNQSQLRFWEFRYQVTLDDHFSWQHLLDQGANLLRELSQSRSSAEAQQRPLLFVCHSLGGCILKQALSVANFQHPRYDFLLNAIVGIVFLGTPHSARKEETFVEQCLWILKAANNGLSNKQLKTDASLMTNLAARFQDINTNIDILSVYEEKPSSISRTLRTRKLVLVDQELAKIDALQETLLGVDLSHLDICSLNDEYGKPNSHAKAWVENILQDAVRSTEDRLRTSKSRTPSDPLVITELSLEAAEHALERDRHGAGAEDSTRSAQYGSSTLDLEIINLVEAFAPNKKQACLPCRSFGGYHRNEEFTGRQDELDVLDSVLLPQRGHPASSEFQSSHHATICGMAGLGKTELALEFAHSRAVHFDAVFWIQADTLDKLERDFADIAVKLGLEDSEEPRDLVVNRETAKGWLSKPTKLLDLTHDTVGQTEASWLIVLDNADDPDLLTDYAHIFGSGSWLLTSRHPHAKTAFSRDTKVVDLEPLDDQVGAQLFQNLTHTEDVENLSTTVSQRLGGLPLAITQMAGIVRREHMSLRDFLEVYQDETERPMDSPTGSLSSLNMMDLELEHRTGRARGTIASIWAIDSLKPRSRSLLEAMIFLDPDCVQDFLMKDQCAQVIKDPHFPKRLKAFFAARAELMDSSLLKKIKDDTGVRLHRVLQDAVRVKLKRSLEDTFADTVAVLCEAWPSAAVHEVHDVGRWPRCKELYAHVVYLRDGYKKQFLEGKNVTRFQYARLLYEAGWYQHAIGNSYAIRHMLEEAQNICETLDRGQQIQNLITDTHYTLGAIANKTNDAASCLRHTTAFLNIRLQIAKETQVRDIRLAVAYNEIGIAKMMSNDLDEAEKLFESAIEVYSSLPDFRKDMCTVSHANRGCAAWLKGDLLRAAEIFEQAIRDREELFGFLDKENFRCGRLWYGLGNVRYTQGRYQQSWECHRNAFKQAEATVGIRHHRVADICHRIAQHLLRNSDVNRSDPDQAKKHIDQAREVIDQALKIWDANKAAYKPELTRSSFLKAKILHRDGKFEEATRLFEEAARSRKELTGDIGTPDRDLSDADFDALVTFWSR